MPYLPITPGSMSRRLVLACHPRFRATFPPCRSVLFSVRYLGYMTRWFLRSFFSGNPEKGLAVFIGPHLLKMRCTMAASFHKERKAWFQIKHQIVGTYLSLFLG